MNRTCFRNVFDSRSDPASSTPTSPPLPVVFFFPTTNCQNGDVIFVETVQLLTQILCGFGEQMCSYLIDSQQSYMQHELSHSRLLHTVILCSSHFIRIHKVPFSIETGLASSDAQKAFTLVFVVSTTKLNKTKKQQSIK